MDFIGYEQAVDIEEHSCAKRALGVGREIKRPLLELVHNKKIVKCFHICIEFFLFLEFFYIYNNYQFKIFNMKSLFC
jgi:hypothetical protein